MFKSKYRNRTAIVISLLLTVSFLFVLMSIKVNAAAGDSMKTTANFTYNTDAKTLTGWVISKKPNEVAIEVQYAGNQKESYMQALSTVLLGYDDTNAKNYQIYYQLTLSDEPTAITVSDGTAKALAALSADGYVKYTYEESLYVSKERVDVTTFELSEVIAANAKLYVISATEEGMDGMEMDFYRNINHSEVAQTDFVLVDDETGEKINMEWVLPIYSFDEIAKTKTLVANGLQLKFAKELVKGHSYTFMTSETADGKEFSGGDNMKSRIRVGTLYQSYNEVVGENLWNLMTIYSSKELTATNTPAVTPPVNPELPPVAPENPPVNPENPPANPENPPANPENPPANPENPPANSENPSVTPQNPNKPTKPSQTTTSNDSTASAAVTAPKTSDNTPALWIIIMLAIGAVIVGFTKVYQVKKEEKM